MAVTFKFRFGEDIRRYRHPSAFTSLPELLRVVQDLFQIPGGLVELHYAPAPGSPAVVVSAEFLPVLQMLTQQQVATLTVVLRETTAPAPSPSPSPAWQPFPSLASDALPSMPTTSYSSSPAPRPKAKPANIGVPAKYRAIIWSLQDEYPEATEFRVLQLIIRLAADVPTIRQQLHDLQAQFVLRRDSGRRGRPRKQPPPPLYFPVPFQEKVRTLVQLGFEQARVIDALIQFGGSAKHASLFLLGENPMSPSVHHAYAGLASDLSRYAGAMSTAAVEPVDQPPTMDQRIVDSLLLLERTHGFDRREIRRAAESLARSPTVRADMHNRETVINSIPAATVEALASLSQMGFTDTVGNIVLLDKHKGDVTRVIDELMSRPRTTAATPAGWSFRRA